MAEKTTQELVIKSLGTRGKTTAQIAEKIGRPFTTVGTILSALVKSGDAIIVGSKQTADRGRPSNLYAKA